MFAIVETGGKQYKVALGTAVAIEKIATEPGATVELDKVLVVGDGENVTVGTPYVDGAVVRAHVIEQGRGEKLIVFKYKSKSNYRRRTGHRQYLTRIRVTEIVGV